MCLVGAVTLLVWLQKIRLWHLHALTFAFGIAHAFALPAGPALVPTLVEPVSACQRAAAGIDGDDPDGRTGSGGMDQVTSAAAAGAKAARELD